MNHNELIELAANLLGEAVDLTIATANDVNSYLGSDVPLECYAKDIDRKLVKLSNQIELLMEKLPEMQHNHPSD